MRLRSYADLDFPLAWQRVVEWARGGTMDLPERLPFEVLARMYDEGLQPRPNHHLAPVTLVTSSKKSGTSRVFPRIDPSDLMLYQALVDQLATDIEATLPPRDRVMAYRQNLEGSPHAFAGTPGRAAFESRVQQMLEEPFFVTSRYALTADIAGYFLHVNVDELEHRLYAASARHAVIRDLTDLLRGWSSLGVRGLPQGVRPSAPLGNLYLRPVDDLLAHEGVDYVRWMDDWVVAASGFHEARRIQDLMEQQLYDIGLTMASDKTRILRGQTAIAESESAKERLARAKRARVQVQMDKLAESQIIADYEDDEAELPDPGELDLDATLEIYDRHLDELEQEDLPKQFRSMVTEILRDLASISCDYRLDRIPRLVERAPDLTGVATRYLVAVAKQDLPAVTRAFSEMLATNRFTREFERLELCQGVLMLPLREAGELASTLGDWAMEDSHDLVRARALLAWGAQSDEADFSLADLFWKTATAPWRVYALLSIQSKEAFGRDARYSAWSGEGRSLGALATTLKSNPIRWSKL